MQSTFSRVLGFQEMQPTGSGVAARRLEKTDSVVVADLPGPGSEPASEPATPVPLGGVFTRHTPREALRAGGGPSEKRV